MRVLTALVFGARSWTVVATPTSFPPPSTLPIFFHEASAVLCALHWWCQFGLKDARRIVIYSDNTNTVDIFHSLKARGPYNELLKLAVDFLMERDLDLRVLHVAGVDNPIADALSRRLLTTAARLRPTLNISYYSPPAMFAGAAS